MTGLSLRKPEGRPLQILCLGAHSDDIEIGCGGTVLQLQRAFPDVKIHWVVFSAAGERRAEAEHSLRLFTPGRGVEASIEAFRDGFLQHQGVEVKERFEALKLRVNPDVIFTQWSGDAHQDHRLLSELTWNTFRNHLILEYEIPKWDGDLGRPNVFVPLPSEICEEKMDHLFAAFGSQSKKSWFDREVFRGLMRIRGMEANSPSGYAEAFYSRKAVLEF